MLMEKMSRKPRGFTLTEAAIVLGIVGLILGAIWTAAAAVYGNQRVATTSTQLLQIVSGVRAAYATTPTFPAALPAGANAAGGACLLANAGSMPKDMVTLNAAGICQTTANVWGGDVEVSAAAGSASFDVLLRAIPNEACRALVLRVGGSGHDRGLVNIAGAGAVNLTTVAATSLADAATVCGGNATQDLTITVNLR